jgi:type II secretory pathway pseudopilin PulG
MHFRLPKALHGWRGFLKEYAIVVLGVLTALVLEQMVQAAHDRALAREARQAINQELQDNLDRVAYRADQQACNERRLNEVQALLAGWHGDDAFPAGLRIGFPGDVGVSDQRWQANLTSGRFSEESAEEQADQAGLYTLIRVIDMIENKEIDYWVRLRMLELGSQSLSIRSKPMIADALAGARSEGEAIKALSATLENNLRNDSVSRPSLRPRKYPVAVPGSACEPMRKSS